MNYHIPIYKLSLSRDGSVAAERKTVSKSQDLYPLLASYFEHHDREEMLVVLLDAKHRIVGLHTVSIGSLTLSIVHPRETFKAAIVSNCAAIILAHNHPSGDPTPSEEDRILTKRLKQGGELLGIPVLDHLVIGEGKYVSFADHGWLND
ncbi:MAG: DNA repair protein RadC [Actinobacteria bacterium]|nr:MAG: DNA repair protein RadC [Actinomycetota bacterium]